jgi:hypothetical protein
MNSSDLSNILQGDDNYNHINSNPQNIIDPPTSDFSEPDHMDSRNKGDHDQYGRFNPFGGLPPNPQGNFTRQMGPLRGGKHVDEDDTTLNPIVDPSVPSSSLNAPKLGEKRDDEPDYDRIGLDPSQGKMKID